MTKPITSAARVSGASRVAAPKRFTVSPRLVLVGLIVATMLLFSAFDPRVLSAGNVRNIGVQLTYLALFAAAQSIVILTRGFDLSLGTTVSLVSIVSSMAMAQSGLDPVAAIALGLLVGLVVGLVIGLVNGALVAFGRINPFVATLAMMNILATFSATVSGGFPVSNLPPTFSILATAAPLGIPIQIWIVGVALLSLHFLLSATAFGRAIYILGSNPRAAHVAGLPTRRTFVVAYGLCSLLAALGALLLTARTGSGEPNLGGDLMLKSIAAAVLGGMRLRGGEGDMAAPVLGALLVTVLANGMDLVQIDGFIQQIFLGIIIIAALAVDEFRRTN